MRRIFWIVLLALAFVAPVFGADPVPVAAPWWHSLLASDTMGNVVAGALAILVAWLGKTARAQKIRDLVDDETEKRVEAAAIHTYHELWKGIKAKYGDSDVPEAQKAEARAHAFDSFIAGAKEMDKGPVKDALLEIGKHTFTAVLERKIGEMKRTNSTPE